MIVVEQRTTGVVMKFQGWRRGFEGEECLGLDKGLDVGGWGWMKQEQGKSGF